MSIKLEIVTPEKLFFSQDVEMATLPGSEGEFGVLQDHAPLIAELQEGEIDIFASQNGAPQTRYYIDGGVAQIVANTCTVLAGTVTVVDANHPAPSKGGANREEAENGFHAKH